jgi:hypothetical protein
MDGTFTTAQYNALLRVDFAGFAHRAFCELNPRTPFAMNWHFEAIAAKLVAVRDGRICRLIINVPPRHLKSPLASVAFPAWCLGRDPSTQILCVSYAQDLADKLARDCRRIITSDWYQRLFPTRLSPRHQAVAEFETTAQGCRLATSVGGVLTGRGADIIIVDDPLKPEEALSQTQRQATNEWFDHTLFSRLNDKRKGAIVLIMHRLHEDDLVGHVLAQEPWEVVVRLPAIADEDETHMIEAAIESRCVARARGEVLHPEREPPEMLEQIRRTIGEYNFAGQYQQTPSPQGGGMVKAAWFRRYAANERLDEFDRVVQSWDTANKGERAQRFQRVHALGHEGQGPLSIARIAPAYGISRIEARSVRAMHGVQCQRGVDRGQGLGNPIDPGTCRVRSAHGHPLPNAVGQGHADARPDRDDRERLCASAQRRGVAPRVSARIDGFSQRQARRPGRLDRPDARLVQASRQRPQLQCRDLAFVQRAVRSPAVTDSKAAAVIDVFTPWPPLVTTRPERDRMVAGISKDTKSVPQSRFSILNARSPPARPLLANAFGWRLTRTWRARSFAR